MEMPESIAKLMPEMLCRAKITETDRLKELRKSLRRNWAWLATDQIAQYLAIKQVLDERMRLGTRKRKVGTGHVAVA